MTKVDFYLLQQASTLDQADDFACRLAEKAFKRGLQVLIAARSAEHAGKLDDLLWQQPDSGFIPHSVGQQLQSPVIIDYNRQPGEHDECLINLSGSVLDYCARFERLCEIVVYEEQSRQQSRQRYKYYKDRGFPIKTHEIKH